MVVGYVAPARRALPLHSPDSVSARWPDARTEGRVSYRPQRAPVAVVGRTVQVAGRDALRHANPAGDVSSCGSGMRRTPFENLAVTAIVTSKHVLGHTGRHLHRCQIHYRPGHAAPETEYNGDDFGEDKPRSEETSSSPAPQASSDSNALEAIPLRHGQATDRPVRREAGASVTAMPDHATSSNQSGNSPDGGKYAGHMTVYGYAMAASVESDDQAAELIASGCTHVFSDAHVSTEPPGSGWLELVDRVQRNDTVRIVNWGRLTRSTETARFIRTSLANLGVHVETLNG
ncbi:hypothetical protein GZL_01636 [Streptomyces sp. 769]|nr:hypothetical protein GZL_01636 [Streptomyces sp. 769]